MMREVSYGWFVRILHSNLASLYMFLMYRHVLKALYYTRYRIKGVWARGLAILLGSMATAFFGYILVWSQIRYWAGVVITSLLTVLPGGNTLLYWVWGGYRLGSAFLKMRFVVHFLLPWGVLLGVMFHLLALHRVGRTSAGHYRGCLAKGWFWPYYGLKDILNLVILCGFLAYVFFYPFSLRDPEMFVEVNKMTRPAHIVPEWYFCAHYGILRSISNKQAGVFLLVLSTFGFFFFYF